MTPDTYAVIFDVDGVLLDLTRAEEDLFFSIFTPYCDPEILSRNWNSYRIRNDDDIVDEIMERHGIPGHRKPAIVADYFEKLGTALTAGTVASPAIPGAQQMLAALSGNARLGFATANFREAARLRLVAAGLWEWVADLAFGADGGGHKHQILARALSAAGLPPERVVYVGDNVNDVEAGLKNGTHFIGFSLETERRRALAAAGARQLSANHDTTLQQILRALAA